MNIPRAEFPNPQFERKDWLCLNGQWEFEFDPGNSLLDQGILERDSFTREITVPFCLESELSGIGYKDFMPAVWYRRRFEIDESKLSGKVFICFGAVDYEATVYINGSEAGKHKGGYTSFRFDITKYLRAGENTVTVRAVDDTRSPYQPTGKQSEEFASHGCHYTRTTGIWQSVWLEFTPKDYIRSFRVFTDAVNGTVSVQTQVEGSGELSVSAFYDGKEVGSFKKKTANTVTGEIILDEKHLWEPGAGRLYDLELRFGGDVVYSYFGLRNVAIDGYKFLINGKSVFQRLVLDQGFYPDGIYTAPTDDALKRDIELSMAAGFNGARLHEKVFEPRFLYYCDKAGYLVWGEYPNWGIEYSDPLLTEIYINEWTEAVNRDFNHPAIIGWCPFNETWNYDGREQRNELLESVYRVTKLLDPERPVIDTSGNFHVITDIWDVHNYEQNVEKFRETYAPLVTEGKLYDPVNRDMDAQYSGGIVFVSEYGGIRWSVEDSDQKAWGYGDAPRTEEEFKARYKGLTDVLLDNEKMFGFCYTQLTDVEQEQNGVYTYWRKNKFDTEFFRSVNSRKAAIED